MTDADESDVQVGEQAPPTRAALRLSPLAPDDPRRLGLRGVTIHWPDSTVAVVKRRRRKSPEIVDHWRYNRIPFAALRDDHEDIAPPVREYPSYALRAYALVACHQPIASDAEVYYEVCSE